MYVIRVTGYRTAAILFLGRSVYGLEILVESFTGPKLVQFALPYVCGVGFSPNTLTGTTLGIPFCESCPSTSAGLTKTSLTKISLYADRLYTKGSDQDQPAGFAYRAEGSSNRGFRV